MKRVILLLSMLVITNIMMGQAQHPAKVDAKKSTNIEITKDGNFVAKKSTKSMGNMWDKDIPTDKTYTDSKGNVYPVYIHTITRGDRKGVKVYVVYITPKSGKTYRKELTEVK